MSIRTLSIIYLILCVIAASLAGSRAFFLGGIAAYLILFGRYIQIRKHRALILTAIFVGIFLVSALMLKTDSSLGRILIYKITHNILADHILFGIGFGNFQRDFLLYQAAYFESGNYTIKELLLADNTYFAFNDYLQLSVEGGILVVILIILYWYSIYSVVQIFYKRDYTGFFTTISLVNIIILSSAAFFTYVFNKPIWQALILLSFLRVIYSICSYDRKVLWFSFVITLSFLISIGVSSYYKFYNNSAYSRAHSLAKAGYYEEADSYYQKLSVSQNVDPWILYARGRYELQQNDVDKALSLIRRSADHFSFSEQYQNLGDCYAIKHQNDLAEWYYLKSVNMVPNRFNSRYKLFKFYLSIGKIDSAKECGNNILKLPVKIPSHRITFVRDQIEDYLNEK